MTVQLKIVPQEDWEVLKKYLDADGVVLVPENNLAGVQKLYFHGLKSNTDVDYDFGGEPNVWVDIAPHVDSYAISELCSYANPLLTPEDVVEHKIDCILYGSENGCQTFYVQTCCNQAHIGGESCGCQTYGEFSSEAEAKALAQVMAEALGLPVCKSC